MTLLFLLPHGYTFARIHAFILIYRHYGNPFFIYGTSYNILPEVTAANETARHKAYLAQKCAAEILSNDQKAHLERLVALMKQRKQAARHSNPDSPETWGPCESSKLSGNHGRNGLSSVPFANSILGRSKESLDARSTFHYLSHQVEVAQHVIRTERLESNSSNVSSWYTRRDEANDALQRIYALCSQGRVPWDTFTTLYRQLQEQNPIAGTVPGQQQVFGREWAASDGQIPTQRQASQSLGLVDPLNGQHVHPQFQPSGSALAHHKQQELQFQQQILQQQRQLLQDYQQQESLLTKAQNSVHPSRQNNLQLTTEQLQIEQDRRAFQSRLQQMELEAKILRNRAQGRRTAADMNDIESKALLPTMAVRLGENLWFAWAAWQKYWGWILQLLQNQLVGVGPKTEQYVPTIPDYWSISQWLGID